MRMLLKRIIKSIFPNVKIEVYSTRCLQSNGLVIEEHRLYFDIKAGDGRCIRISRKHNLYLTDIISYFDYYFSAVHPIEIDGIHLVDYSAPRFHEVLGYDLHPIIFPSLAEPMVTASQYLEFAQLSNGSIVLDLGAYSGFTSILFDQCVGGGRVIAVDADETNIKCIKKNFSIYQKISGRKIDLLEGAVWENNGGIMFSHEGNMGSSAVSIVGQYRGAVSKVPSFTLSTIAKMYNLQKIDFIKCDIEGAEAIVFKESEFFDTHRPRMIIEPHTIGALSTIQNCVGCLSKFRYRCQEIKQHGVSVPLLECWPL